MGFDLKTLTSFSPPSFRCAHCLGIIDARISNMNEYWLVRDHASCPLCGGEYDLRESNISEDIASYLHRKKLSIEFKDPLRHAKSLATFAQTWEAKWAGPPIHRLFRLLLRATQFIHLLTWNIDFQMIGAIKMLSHRVPVALAVGGIRSPNIRAELTEFTKETPRLWTRVHDSPDEWAGPHKKLIVVDGLLAVEPSANLSQPAWRKAADNLESVELITDVDRVIELNNRYFVAAWTALDPKPGPIIEGPDEVPF